MPELPPRARRIQNFPPSTKPAWGTTSACAENTRIDGAEILLHRNYLRVRGEYSNPSASRAGPPELPPRARRIPGQDRRFLSPLGTTSACAENTATFRRPASSLRNYLRVRGEYDVAADKIGCPPELPPRARRIPRGEINKSGRPGTTSACAENTTIKAPRWVLCRNYLRVRGEYT